MPTHSKVEYRARDQPAEAGDNDAEQRRQVREAFRQVGRRISGKKFVNGARSEAESDRANRSAKTNDAGPKQSELEVARVRSFFEPHPKLQPPEREKGWAPRFRDCAAVWHNYEVCTPGERSRESKTKVEIQPGKAMETRATEFGTGQDRGLFCLAVDTPVC
jgi:hypothetical protein